MEYLIPALFYVLIPGMAIAGDRFDLYGGPAPLAADAHIDISTNDPSTPLPRNRAGFDPDAQGIAGLRWRLEPEGWPVGLALDIAYQRVRHPQADVKLLPITFGVALPSHHTLAGRPGHGSLHPTAMLGATFTSVGGETTLLGRTDTEIGADLILPLDNGRTGFVAAAGLEWRPRPSFSLFAEYRYQYLRFHETTEHGGFFGPTWTDDASGTFRLQGVVMGLSVPIGFRDERRDPP